MAFVLRVRHRIASHAVRSPYPPSPPSPPESLPQSVYRFKLLFPMLLVVVTRPFSELVLLAFAVRSTRLD